MKTERFYKILILILVLTNVGMMVFMWTNRPPRMPHPPQHEIGKMLGLKGDKLQKVNKLEVDHHKVKRELVHRDMELHEELFVLLENSEKSDSLYTLIDENKAEMERMTYDYFVEIATYCDADQKEILREFLRDSFAKLRGPGPAPFGR